jgi:hypothetical protein
LKSRSPTRPPIWVADALSKSKFVFGAVSVELSMNPEIERNLGEQPIARLMGHNLKRHDLVANSSVEMTHKMVARLQGRRLTLNTSRKSSRR